MNTLFIRTAAATAVIATSAATLLALSATPAAAQEATYEYPQPIVVVKTRAEVMAELAAARADGTLYVSEAGWAFDALRTARRTATPAVAAASPKAKANVNQPLRSDLNTSSFEPYSFDGVVSAANSAVAPTRVN